MADDNPKPIFPLIFFDECPCHQSDDEYATNKKKVFDLLDEWVETNGMPSLSIPTSLAAKFARLQMAYELMEQEVDVSPELVASPIAPAMRDLHRYLEALGLYIAHLEKVDEERHPDRARPVGYRSDGR